jgi:hypothetical protein
MPIKDLEARRAYRREYQRRRYATDPKFKARHVELAKRSDKERDQIVRGLIASFKTSGCLLCGEEESCCLSVHHRDPEEKGFNLGDVRRMKPGADRVAAELVKCVCLCHNCHAKVHAGLIALPDQPA